MGNPLSQWLPLGISVSLLSGCGSALMTSARKDLAAGNPGRAIGTLEVELRRDSPSSDAKDLLREAAQQWAKSEVAKARAEGPARLFVVANGIAGELTKRGYADIAAAEAQPAIAEGLAGIWESEVEKKVKADDIEEAFSAGEALTANAPANSPQHARLEEIRVLAARKHAKLLSEVPPSLKGAMLLHIRMARRYGVQWDSADADAIQVREDSYPAWTPPVVDATACPDLGRVLSAQLKVHPLYSTGLGQAASMNIRITDCGSKVSKTWITKESKSYLHVEEVQKVREDKRYLVKREGDYNVTYEVTKRTPYTQYSFDSRSEMVDVHHVEVDTSASGVVKIQWEGGVREERVSVGFKGPSESWKGQFAGEGGFTPDLGAPLTVLSNLLWVKAGLEMSEANFKMAAKMQSEGEELLKASKTYEAENLLMMASLTGRSISGENQEIAKGTRDYLEFHYGIHGADARTVVLGDPQQKATPPRMAGKPPAITVDGEAVRAQRAADGL